MTLFERAGGLSMRLTRGVASGVAGLRGVCIRGAWCSEFGGDVSPLVYLV